jgi:putative ubiquitin-RnfH superfamily antitoxin RatB of RatAB toxin-antitoxin module
MKEIQIEIAWMTGSDKVERECRVVKEGLTLEELMAQLSSDQKMLPRCGVSVYGKKKANGYKVCENDRIEVCLPLLDDPLLRRRARVKKVKRKV